MATQALASPCMTWSQAHLAMKSRRCSSSKHASITSGRVKDRCPRRRYSDTLSSRCSPLILRIDASILILASHLQNRTNCLFRLFVAFVTVVTEAAWVAAAFQPLGLNHRHGTPFFEISSQAPAHARSCAVLTSTCARGNCRRRAILALKLSAKECGAEERAQDKDPPPNLDPRFYHLFDRSQSKVDQLEHADAMAKTGFELDGAVLINKAGQRIHPETLRGTSVGMYLCVVVATVLQRRVIESGSIGILHLYVGEG